MVATQLCMALLFCSTSPVASFQPLPLATTKPRRTTAPVFYANTVDPPTPAPEQHSNFEDQMRQLVQRQQQLEQRREKKQRRHVFGQRPAALQQVSTVADYKGVVVDEATAWTVVRFYATSCRSCRAATPAFDALVERHQNCHMLNWVEVPVTRDNAPLHQALQIPSVPYGHLYHPHVGLVEEVRLTRPHLPRFQKILQSYLDGSCPLSDQQIDPDTGIYTSPY
eukprot:CAMPEP_0172454164 /NCGR_PEP_ID=MMETSP1065-20121228/11233_1 /TAXON_ID=265537 /ORGANISM="Amphiprora paludosa, Strain CCMP125" /LENGTH=223 /DNA_ID=CAMNT_0013206447 /DNA_START=146 /DNA_END=817 /DNA_ORIENTATION=-